MANAQVAPFAVSIAPVIPAIPKSRLLRASSIPMRTLTMARPEWVNYLCQELTSIKT